MLWLSFLFQSLTPLSTRQLIGSYEDSNDDLFWQLGVTERSDECFVTSCKVVKHIDMRVRVVFLLVETLSLRPGSQQVRLRKYSLSITRVQL